MATETKQQNPKRQALIALSASAKKLVEMGQAETVNDALIKIYKKPPHNEFNTLPEWNKKGFRVVKGEHAFIVWGKPKRVAKKEQAPTTASSDETGYEYFPMAFLFSNAQVMPFSSN